MDSFYLLQANLLYIEKFIYQAMNKIEIVNEVIRSRRSIFPPMYSGEEVSESVMWEILENANWAPTHKMTEPWRFVVIPQAKIPEFCEFGAEWYKKYTPGEKFSEMKLKKIRTKPLKASHIIAICMKRDEEKRVPQWEEEAAVACAVQNMYLTVTAMSLGGYWSTPGYALVADEFLQLEEKEKCLGLFYIGVPRDGLMLTGKRGDIKLKTRWL